MIVCSRVFTQYLSMLLNTCPELTTVARFITQLEAFRQPKGELWDIRLESSQGAGYLRSQLWKIINDASCCLAGAMGYLYRLSDLIYLHHMYLARHQRSKLKDICRCWSKTHALPKWSKLVPLYLLKLCTRNIKLISKRLVYWQMW